MRQFLKDITTCKDGESFDVVRVAMVGLIMLLPPILLWGIIMETWATIASTKDNPHIFDMLANFNAILAFYAAAGAFLMSGSASLYFKRTTEPDGSTSEEESVTKGKQPDVTNAPVIISNP